MSELDIVKIGTEVKPYGKVAGILFIGERYYFLVDKNKVVSLMSASVIEVQYKGWKRVKNKLTPL